MVSLLLILNIFHTMIFEQVNVGCDDAGAQAITEYQNILTT